MLGRKKGKGKQPMQLSKGCYSEITVIHEFMHAIGVHHQQSRPDRDDYITYFEENVIPEKKGNYRKAVFSSAYGTNYDEKSIMHYGSRFFSINETYLDTFTSKVIQ